MIGGSGCVSGEEHSKPLLRQVMREENGCIQKKVYRFTDDPYKERVELYFGNGRLKEVFYRKEGRLEGLRTVFFENGSVAETGHWHLDNRWGEFLYYDQDGHLDCTQYFGLLGESIEAATE